MGGAVAAPEGDSAHKGEDPEPGLCVIHFRMTHVSVPLSTELMVPVHIPRSYLTVTHI